MYIFLTLELLLHKVLGHVNLLLSQHLEILPSDFHLRPGNVILFTLPSSGEVPPVELGMILTVWRGVKAPTPFAGAVNVASSVAFRVLQLEIGEEERGWHGVGMSSFSSHD